MADTDHPPSEPHVLDQPWRLWSSVAVLGILLSGIVLGVLIIPVVQGRRAGLDAYTAICRALGILPGSPAQPQPSDRTPPTPVSQVVWTPDVLQVLARADVRRGRDKVQEVCVPAMARQACRLRRTSRTLPANRAPRSTSSFTITAPEAGYIR